LSGSDENLAQMIQLGGEKRLKIHKLINYIWNKDELPDHWSESIIVPIYKDGDENEYK
jgi:hypothetical protein